jgi:hypothetical protein
VADNLMSLEGNAVRDPVLPSCAEDKSMSKELRELLASAREYRMTPEDIREQAISFAYGNGHIEDSRVTRDGIARAVDAMYREREAPSST